MKILLATFWAGPNTGGLWNYLEQLSKQLESRGHEVDILGYGEGYHFIHIFNRNIRVERSSYQRKIEEKYPSLHVDSIVDYYTRHSYFFELACQSLNLEKYDIIHTHDVFSTVVMKKIKSKKTVLITTIHGCVAHEIKNTYYNSSYDKSFVSEQGSKYFDQIEYEGATASTYTIVANEWLKNVLVNEFHVPAERINILHYGYDLRLFLSRMKRKSKDITKPEKIVIIYTGRLNESKGVHHLISALSQLKKHRTDWVCWIVGSGPNQAELEVQCETLQLKEYVVFMGRRDDVPYLLNLADILVLPTLNDNQPLSIIEAQIAGKAIIASETGGIPEMITHGVTGILVPVGSEATLSIQLNYLITDEEFRERLGINAKRWALNHWTIDREVGNILNLYESALKKRDAG